MAGIGSVKKVILSRHGESEYNERDLIGGDSGLSSKGELYAKALPGALCTLLSKELTAQTPVTVWTSSLKRTKMTARNLPFSQVRKKLLDEINAGLCDGMSYEEIEQRLPDQFEARKQNKLRYRYPNGESYLDVIERTAPIVEEIRNQTGVLVIVAHQAVIRCLLGHLLSLPMESVPTIDVPLHTLIELTSSSAGINERRFPVMLTPEPIAVMTDLLPHVLCGAVLAQATSTTAVAT